MFNITFVLTSFIISMLILIFSFRNLTKEKWQIFASIPLKKISDTTWQGLNLTYYGLITATANILAIFLTIILSYSIGISLSATLPVIIVILSICLPSASIIAGIVEKKKFTLSIGAALFVGIIISPIIIFGANHVYSISGFARQIPIIPFLASFSISYIIGEGFGRLACISFGCCYGKPINKLGPLTKKIFSKFHFRFFGKTKKISYASAMEYEPVVPIQAITSTLYVVTGHIGIMLFLNGYYAFSFILTMSVAQLWRAFSETLRSDHRGEGKISAYQVLALTGTLYLFVIYLFFNSHIAVLPNLKTAFTEIFTPFIIIFLQILWIIIFIYTGKSMVTGSMVSFFVREDRI